MSVVAGAMVVAHADDAEHVGENDSQTNMLARIDRGPGESFGRFLASSAGLWRWIAYRDA
ncbi:hypothetical protein EA187_18010 [Lujinxingia sediminis]|uniref:Uncharacterized protein n=1 Tax=Lujinxingia sediminis TaxID=2480984 RepID=A0ABY0CPK0_9DELT|nr:hypothetical protein [Lujinxingia sediminis]RVU41555.1 hypothetical protein EA187_18010 [Lujinxingia sediminis]